MSTLMSEEAVETPSAKSTSRQEHRVAYIMSRFPKLTETFILFEMQALERQGVTVEVYPLLRARNTETHPEGAGILRKIVELTKAPVSESVMHADAKPFVDRAHFAPFINFKILLAQFWFLTHRPVRYFRMLGKLVRENWGSINYTLGTLSTFPKCVWFARKIELDGVDHIHAHFANHPAAAAYVIHGLTGIPYSFTAHGADFQVDQHMLKEKSKSAQHVITISDYNKRFFIEHCGEEIADRIKVVRCGVDTTVFNSKDDAARNDLHSDSTTVKLVCTGTFYEVKGHRYLIEACQILVEQGIPFECNLVGVGPMQDEIRAMVNAANLADHVNFLGRQTREEIAKLLKNSHILIAPSIPTKSGRREGIPVVLMEAMASELAVVASSISGIPELIDHETNGLLVPPAEPRAIADALEKLIADPQFRRRLGLAARIKVENEYDQTKNAKTLRLLFSQRGVAC